MKIVSICKKCKGQGKIQTLGVIKKVCPLCNGSGKTVKHIKDLKERSSTVIQSPIIHP